VVPLVGYRNSGFQGSGITDPIEIAKWEHGEFQNEDIQYTLFNKKLIKKRSFSEALKFIGNMYSQGYTRCVWVCSTVEDLVENYTYEDEDPLEFVDRYTFTDYEIISDLGDEGLLVLYRPGSVEIEEVEVDGAVGRTMKLSDINLEFQDMGFGPEGERDVREIMVAIRRGEQMPPILVNPHGYLQDGRHRYLAYKRLGFKEIPVEIGYHPSAKVR